MNERRVSYGDEYNGYAQYVPRCKICCRFVKAPKSLIPGDREDHTVCSKCGSTKMIFEGWF